MSPGLIQTNHVVCKILAKLMVMFILDFMYAPDCSEWNNNQPQWIDLLLNITVHYNYRDLFSRV